MIIFGTFDDWLQGYNEPCTEVLCFQGLFVKCHLCRNQDLKSKSQSAIHIFSNKTYVTFLPCQEYQFVMRNYINSMKILCIALKQVLGFLAKWRLKLKSSIWLPSYIRATQSSSRNNRCQRIPFQILWRTKLSLLKFVFFRSFDIHFIPPLSPLPGAPHPPCKKMQKVEEDYVMCLTNCFEGKNKRKHIQKEFFFVGASVDEMTIVFSKFI